MVTVEVSHAGVRREAQRPVRRRRARRAAGAPARDGLAARRARGRRRRRACGARSGRARRYSDDAVPRARRRCCDGVPLIGSGGLGSRDLVGAGDHRHRHRRPVGGQRRSTRCRRQRGRCSTCASIPSRTRSEAQAALIDAPAGADAVRHRADRVGGRDRQRLRGAHRRSRRMRPRARRWSQAWGKEPVTAAGAAGRSRSSTRSPRPHRTPRSCSSARPTATRTSTRPTSGS